ncbi:VOC family protein [Acanthopleuribacter pedis]|uniref:Glyoxalase/fosfomycin resistance/dioxygenase domain-containing protein n=1 Tax=Acanthopleuribacter pedis TaxID=442870 RepID=A0A8J7QLK2_9BACT|nr:VOC family protein [Acanthopleuribacter pedis]MBO1320528.1 hypothetical protein [Acanthopleuribacter pedis]
MTHSSAPKGYFTVCPYLVLENPEAELTFLTATFGAEIRARLHDDQNRVKHAEVLFGDSMVMIGLAGGPEQALPGMVHVYVPDCDQSYAAALAAGAETIMAPADQFYGDRSAGVRSSNGISWWIATQKEVVTPEETQRRLLAQNG